MLQVNVMNTANPNYQEFEHLEIIFKEKWNSFIIHKDQHIRFDNIHTTIIHEKIEDFGWKILIHLFIINLLFFPFNFNSRSYIQLTVFVYSTFLLFQFSYSHSVYCILLFVFCYF